MIIAVVGAGYLAAALAGIEVYWVTLGGGVTLAVIAIMTRKASTRDLASAQPAALYAFVAGRALLAAALALTLLAWLA